VRKSTKKRAKIGGRNEKTESGGKTAKEKGKKHDR